MLRCNSIFTVLFVFLLFCNINKFLVTSHFLYSYQQDGAEVALPTLRMSDVVTTSTTTNFQGVMALRKRSDGCAEINFANKYVTEGQTFSIFCDLVWHAVNSISFTYTLTFVDCMNACISWNKNHTSPQACVGVVWGDGYCGPLGAQGGSICSIQWNMVLSQGYNQTSFDSARLLSVPLPTVTHMVFGQLT